jgi:hypothetical protein
MQQPADEGGFAIIHAARGRKTQELFLQVLLEKVVEFFSEQGSG